MKVNKAEGPYIYSDGKQYIDFSSLSILGHNNQKVREEIIEELDKGPVIGVQDVDDLTQMVRDYLDVEVVHWYPSIRAAAMEVSVKALDASKKQHGNSPKPVIAMCTPDFVSNPVFEYNKADTLERLLGSSEYHIAAVRMQPYIHKKPKVGFLKRVRNLCTQHKALLIFDETITGLRTFRYFSQLQHQVRPDITILGDTTANGLPIACVCGSEKILGKPEPQVLNPFSVAAARVTLKVVRDMNVPHHLDSMGERLISTFNNSATTNHCTGAQAVGYACRPKFIFPKPEQEVLFKKLCLKEGVYFGDNIYPTFAHKSPHMDVTTAAIRYAFSMLRKYWENPEEAPV